MNKRKGFTIVELLIVIVVIGILASVTVVAYSGIQQRATASKVASQVGQYKRLIEQYKIDNNGLAPLYYGSWGLQGSGTCLGRVEAFPVSANFPTAGLCKSDPYPASAPSNNKVAKAQFIDALKQYGEPPDIIYPEASDGPIYGGDMRYRGVEYTIGFFNAPNTVLLRWLLKGDVTCGTGDKTYHAGGNLTLCMLYIR